MVGCKRGATNDSSFFCVPPSVPQGSCTRVYIRYKKCDARSSPAQYTNTPLLSIMNPSHYLNMEDGTEEYYAQPPFYYYCQPPNPEIVRLFRDVASYLTKCDTCGAKPFKGIICPSAFKWDKLCCMS